MDSREGTSLRVKDLPRVERPREKLVKYGPGKLSDSELLAILLRSGKKGENVVALAGKILKRFGKETLPNAPVAELKGYPGVGTAKACEIVAAFELGKRFLRGKKAEVYLSPEDVWRQLQDVRTLKKEHFVVFYLDTRNQEIKREVIAVGSLTASLVHPREVFEPAVRNLAAQIIVAHNHPSGHVDPSDDDVSITKRLVEAGKILGIEVVDHVIVTKTGFLSFREKNLV